MPNLFELKDASFRVKDKTIIDGVTFSIPEGGCFCIVGPSGSGKSSIVRMLNRLNRKTSGEILYLGKPIESYNVQKLRREVAMVFQKTSVFEGTVADNLRMVLELAGEKHIAMDDVRLAQALAAAGLTHEALHATAATMSGGEQQRVGIARALMTQPKVLLMDEPTASLDVEAANKVLATVKKLSRTITVIMVNHHLVEVKKVATHVAMIDHGKLVETADVDKFFNHPQTERLQTFLNAYHKLGEDI